MSVEILAILVTIGLALIGGFFKFFWDRISKALDEVKARVTTQEAGLQTVRAAAQAGIDACRGEHQEQFKQVREDMHRHEMKAKDEFASVGYLQDVERRIVGGMDRMDAKLDRLIENLVGKKAAAE